MDGGMRGCIPGWHIVRTIGKGSFGTVYEIEKEGEFGSGVRSALKVISIPESPSEIAYLRNEGYDEDSMTELFKSRVEDITSEFRLMNKLKGSRNVVSFEDFLIVQHDEDPGYDVMIRMELLTSLPDYVRMRYEKEPITDAIVRKVGIDICSALELCRERSIIHRDIKPQNIFVNAYGDFKLGDFGVAKTSDHTTRATKTGTFGYMAPEVYWGKPYNAQVDIYSLGLVMYWMLNERRGPFLPLPPVVPKSAQSAEALDRRISGEPLPMPKHGSEALKRIVLKACAFDPKDRYASPEEMKHDLELLTGGTINTGFVPSADKQGPAASAQSEAVDEQTVWGVTKGDPYSNPMKLPTEETIQAEMVLSVRMQDMTETVYPETPDDSTISIDRSRADGNKSKKLDEMDVSTEDARTPIDKNTINAEEQEDIQLFEKEEPDRKKNRILLIALIAVLAAAAVVIVLLRSFSGTDEKDRQAEMAATEIPVTAQPTPELIEEVVVEEQAVVPTNEPTPTPSPTPEPTDTPQPTEIPFSYYCPTVNMSFEELVGSLPDFDESNPRSNDTFLLPKGYPAPDTYRIIVDLYWQIVMIYAKDENGNYTVPVRYMSCSAGSNIQAGTFQMKPTKVRFGNFKTGETAQYWSLIRSRTYFHSTIYSKYRDLSSVDKASYEAVTSGTKASHACIRLLVPDARWIFYNICYDTTCEIRKGSKDDEEMKAIREQMHFAAWKDDADLSTDNTPYTDNWTIEDVQIDMPYIHATQPPDQSVGDSLSGTTTPKPTPTPTPTPTQVPGPFKVSCDSKCSFSQRGATGQTIEVPYGSEVTVYAYLHLSGYVEVDMFDRSACFVINGVRHGTYCYFAPYEDDGWCLYYKYTFSVTEDTMVYFFY